jgi:hypothetical protein
MSDERRNAIQQELAALRDAARANSGTLDPDQQRRQAALHAERDAIDAAAIAALRARGPVVDPSKLVWQAEMDERRRHERRAGRVTFGVIVSVALLTSLVAVVALGPAGLFFAVVGIAFGSLRYAQMRSRMAVVDWHSAQHIAGHRTSPRGRGERWP